MLSEACAIESCLKHRYRLPHSSTTFAPRTMRALRTESRRVLLISAVSWCTYSCIHAALSRATPAHSPRTSRPHSDTFDPRTSKADVCPVNSTIDLSLERTHPGYCHPHLVCPKTLPVAYLESPRSACTSFKSMLAHVEGEKWAGHGKTRLRCCTDTQSADKRLKFIVVRNPFARAISSFMHSQMCNKWCVNHFDEKALDNFTSWFAANVKKSLTNQNTHFTSQFGQFEDKRLEYPYNPREFFVIHLETVSKDWLAFEKTLQRCYSHDIKLPPVPVTHAVPMPDNSVSTSQLHVLLLHKRPSLVKLIQEHYYLDFKFFGYSTDPFQQFPMRSHTGFVPYGRAG